MTLDILFTRRRLLFSFSFPANLSCFLDSLLFNYSILLMIPMFRTWPHAFFSRWEFVIYEGHRLANVRGLVLHLNLGAFRAHMAINHLVNK